MPKWMQSLKWALFQQTGMTLTNYSTRIGADKPGPPPLHTQHSPNETMYEALVLYSLMDKKRHQKKNRASIGSDKKQESMVKQ